VKFIKLNAMTKIKRFWIYPAAIMCLLLLQKSSCKKEDDNSPPVDFEGKVYQTVTIGSQLWMAENLSTAKLNDGTEIELVTSDNDRWSRMETPGYTIYRNEVLYNGSAVSSGKLAPKGWHVPTDEEWTTLITYLGGEEVAGGKMKESGTTHWMDPNTGASNSSGFSAIAAGFRNGSGWFYYSGVYGYWWCSTGDAWGLYYINLSSYSEAVVRGSNSNSGFSVRCVKD
jgi:uncharacterized protein (TIGR02145 family)